MDPDSAGANPAQVETLSEGTIVLNVTPVTPPGAIVGGGRNNTLEGTAEDNWIDGRGGNDTLYGNGGNDTLDGGQGDDWLEGELGDDWLTGGEGTDVFSFNAGDGADVITDFQLGSDQIELNGDIFSSDPPYTIASDANGSAILNLSGGGSVTLAGTDREDLITFYWNFFAFPPTPPVALTLP